MSGVERPSLMGCYVDSVKKYLQYQWPNLSEDKLEQFIKKYIQENIKRPKATVVAYPEYGNQELKELDLLSIIRKTNNKTITPFGTIYETTDVKIPTNKQFLDHLVATRDKAKAEMFSFIEQGKKEEASIKDSEQSLNKIAANSVSGGHGTPVNALYDPETYNAITSLCRHGTMIAYTFAERFLSGNYYFPTFEDAINFIITTSEKCPPIEQVREVLEKYNLTKIDSDDLEDLIVDGMSNYTTIDKRKLMFFKHDVLSRMYPEIRSFVYYSRSLYNLFKQNKDIFIKLFTTLSTLNESEECMSRTDVSLDDIKNIDGDVVQALQTIYSEMLGSYVIKKLPKENPELGIQIAKIAKSFQEILDYWKPVIDMFLHSNTMISKAHINKFMFRKAIIVSDTDSIIYTTKDIITMYLGGEFTYNNKFVYSVHALVTYFLCKSVASLLRMVAVQRGAVGEKNIRMLKMKNEFLYPVFIRTNLAKHYIGFMTIREGVVLKDPEIDCKGVGFKTSNVPKVTHEFTDALMRDLIDDALAHTKVYAGDYISRALQYEEHIFNSLKNGDLTYYTNTPIKKKEEYKTPDASIYSNYMMWQEVFGDKYGEIRIPNKCPVIPFIKNKFKNKGYLNWLSMKSPVIYDKLIHYIEKNPKKNISRLPIPITCLTIPEEIIPLIDIRAIIYKNMAPTQLILRTVGVDLGNPKKFPLLMDYYTTTMLERSND